MVVGSKGPAAPTGPESPAGPINDRRRSEERESLERSAGRFQEILPDDVPGAGDLVHVPIPVLEHAVICFLDLIEDGAHPLADRGEALARVDHREVYVLPAFDEDPVVAEVEVVQLAVLAVDKRVADELLDRGQHPAEDVLVLVLGQAPGEVVEEESIAVHEEHLLDLHALPANE